MRATIPETPPLPTDTEETRPGIELTGVYLQAMQEISGYLMDRLPAEDSLWHTLAETEALLVEAQMQSVPLREVFGNGGTAAFCQSIVDEYRHRNPADASKTPAVPASQDPGLRPNMRPGEPRGGINYYRKRRATAIMITVMSLVFLLLAAWYTGLLRYWTVGSGFYLEEIYNFQSTVTAAGDIPIRFSVPLSPATDMNLHLFTDADGNEITLTDISYETHRVGTEHDDGTVTLTDYRRWTARLAYPVKAGYTKIVYTEPSSTGTATLTLADGTTQAFAISTQSSGAAGQGYESITLILLELPVHQSTEGAELSVELEPPRRVVWSRVGVGKR